MLNGICFMTVSSHDSLLRAPPLEHSKKVPHEHRGDVEAGLSRNDDDGSGTTAGGKA